MAWNTRRWLWMLAAAAGIAAQATAATEAQCNQLLQQALESKNPDTRKQAVAALSLAASRGPLFDTLEQMLGDNDVQVREAVVASLAEVKTRKATAALLRALNDEVPEVSFAAAKALFARHDPAGRQALLSVLAKENKATSNFFSTKKRTALRMMHTPRTAFLFAVREGASFAPVPGLGQGIASMQGILTDSGVSGRATAALMLSNDKAPATLEALKDALFDKDASVRAAAVHSLSLRNDPALIKTLEPLLEDDKEAVRLRAAAAYLRLSSIRAAAGKGTSTTAPKP